MKIYSFLITLKNQRDRKTEDVMFDCMADNYLTAWKESCDAAWGSLNDHDKYWFIETIKHCI